MEKQLAEYRAKKEKERRSQQSWTDYLFRGRKEPSPRGSESAETRQNITQTKNVSHIQNGEVIYHETEEEVNDSSNRKYFTLQNILIVILWLLCWKIFIELQFGAVFFLISGFLFIYFNTRTGPKSSRLSAYSVFNPNFERLEGTLTAEQFESELLRRPVSKDDS
ncbi:hypothetical protein LOTGIDRAFT_232604, partial [Lottia gigantea]